MTATTATDALTSTTGYTYTRKSEAAGTDASGNTVTNQSEAQDRFLKLLVAQLNNQDPMNPLDNAQMTSQIAQINTVTGIQQLNSTVTSLATQMAAMQGIQASALVGREVITEGKTLSIDTTAKKGTGTFELSGDASNVKVDILSASGTALGTVPLGRLAAGRHEFAWDTGSYGAKDGLQFKVTATSGTTPVGTTSLVRNKVASIGSDTGGALTLQFQNGTSAPYTAVKSIL
ncbi:flagellar hook capping FlgD N-terminal domain-containing protein [uncultured Xylophilus sp.]|uniref:flagellar hook assembly protein FlgD n=1 Tax=uncultured Xylophilus sp. TaxID=296832 RepID=UPI0025F0A8C7|nr:flagellar hook capping FlgD N-terminal domain-containing protein [uncultured Xylophilus sp.]